MASRSRRSRARERLPSGQIEATKDIFGDGGPDTQEAQVVYLDIVCEGGTRGGHARELVWRFSAPTHLAAPQPQQWDVNRDIGPTVEARRGAVPRRRRDTDGRVWVECRCEYPRCGNGAPVPLDFIHRQLAEMWEPMARRTGRHRI